MASGRKKAALWPFVRSLHHSLLKMEKGYFTPRFGLCLCWQCMCWWLFCCPCWWWRRRGSVSASLLLPEIGSVRGTARLPSKLHLKSTSSPAPKAIKKSSKLIYLTPILEKGQQVAVSIISVDCGQQLCAQWQRQQHRQRSLGTTGVATSRKTSSRSLGPNLVNNMPSADE